jgi:phosphatidylglycerophosphatase A
MNLAVFLATGMGAGRAPWAPGTFGSLVGIPIAAAIGLIDGMVLQGLAVVLFCAVGVPIVNAALPHLGGSKDPNCVVIDEITAIPITFFALPLTSVTVVVLGFLLFRLFDITKPSPVRNLEKLPAGVGVMADDWAAGVYANLALRGILAVSPAAWFTF